jgi:hypothetical protein
VTNPLKNGCENANTQAHGVVYLVVLAHLQRRSWSNGVDLDQFREEKEKKRASLGCPRDGKRNQTCGQCAAQPGGGTALSGVHQTPQYQS